MTKKEPKEQNAKESTASLPVLSGSGAQISTLEQAYRFATLAVKGGFAPKHANIEGAACAIVFGMELGLSPLQGLQNVAVINGHPSIFGDAVPAIVDSSGQCELREEWYEVGGARVEGTAADITQGIKDRTLTAVCRVRKRGKKEPHTVRFSLWEADREGVTDEKRGKDVWRRFPRRMLMRRARRWALSDEFPGVLKGLISDDEAHELPSIRDVPPEEVTIDGGAKPFSIDQLRKATEKRGNGASEESKEQPPEEKKEEPEQLEKPDDIPATWKIEDEVIWLRDELGMDSVDLSTLDLRQLMNMRDELRRQFEEEKAKAEAQAQAETR